MGPARRSDDAAIISVARPCMGSLLEITLYETEADRCRLALEAAFAEAERLENLLSLFKPDTELVRVNRHAADDPVKADPELIALIQRGLSLARLTQGAFDVTVAPLLRLWGFRNHRNGKALLSPPPADQIQDVLQSIGHRHVIVDVGRSTVVYRTPGVEIEFGAMGKGYAVDRAVEILQHHGVTRALVSFGSSTYALGHPPGREGWRIAIRHPRRVGCVMGVVVLKDCAIATSGDYEQGVRLNGRRYGHIMDPRSGCPAIGTVSASVVAPTALEADAFSTAAFVLGQEAGVKMLADQAGVEGLIVREEKNGRLSSAQLGRRQFLAALLATLGWLILQPSSAYAIVYLTREEALRRLMPQAVSVREETITLTPMQKEQIQRRIGSQIRGETYTFWIGERDGAAISYAVVLDVIGKEQPITFMVAVSPEGTVQGVEVLVYRESQGSEIRSRRFMQQFAGKTLAAPLRLGRDIDSISGASLSSRSTAYAVKKALILVETLYESGGSPSQ